ncbi:MAG: hypothetical protein ACR2N2_11955 [Acidimicrobiia bacterium]
MRPRTPIAYAGLLIIALVAVVGFAAFSPSSTPETLPPTTNDDVEALETSARVASAVLALRVSDAESRTATTQTAPTTTTAPGAEAAADEPSTTTEASTTTDAPTTTQASTTTAAPATSSAAKDTTPPKLRVTSPDDGATVTNRIVEFRGTSEPGARVTAGPYEADVADDGDWQIELVLAPGANGAVFTAVDKAGNESSVRIVVNYEVATTTTKATTTTTKATTTTTSGSSGSKWSPNWPADSGGIRNVENWRSTVSQYWPAHRVDCVLGIIHRESKGDPRAFNASSSAEGLMQHLSKYWHSRAVGAGFVDGNGLVATPYNGKANIAAGAYLANWAETYQSAWWWPWKSSGGVFTAQYGSCTASNPG